MHRAVILKLDFHHFQSQTRLVGKDWTRTRTHSNTHTPKLFYIIVHSDSSVNQRDWMIYNGNWFQRVILRTRNITYYTLHITYPS